LQGGGLLADAPFVFFDGQVLEPVDEPHVETVDRVVRLRDPIEVADSPLAQRSQSRFKVASGGRELVDDYRPAWPGLALNDSGVFELAEPVGQIKQVYLLYSAEMTSAVLEVGTELGVATARFFRVLSDPTRLAILELLGERPRTVSELVVALDCPQSRVSNHLACLRWCEFVDTERQGRQVTYRIREERVQALIEAARAMATEHCEHLASCTRIGPDWI